MRTALGIASIKNIAVMHLVSQAQAHRFGHAMSESSCWQFLTLKVINCCTQPLARLRADGTQQPLGLHCQALHVQACAICHQASASHM